METWKENLFPIKNHNSKFNMIFKIIIRILFIDMYDIYSFKIIILYSIPIKEFLLSNI